MLCGGSTGAEVDDRIRGLVNQVKTEVEKQTNVSYSVFEPVEAMKQVVGYISEFLTFRLLV